LTIDTATASLDDVFDVLAASALDASSRGAVLYGAQAKKQLTRAFPGFTERHYGFNKFVGLLQAGHEQGRFTLEIVDGHPRLTGAGDVAPARRSSTVWLKSDLWATLLTWDSGQRRWDRRRDRAIFIPTTEDGQPLWEASPEDFVDIEPVTMAEQLQWMDEFANAQPDSTAAALQAALADRVPGAFRRELTKLNLQQGWTTYLQQRVAEHATTWAANNGVALGSIVETRGKAPAVPATPRPAPTTTSTAPATAEEELRARLHRVIDKMSLAELAALPVPAGHLFTR